MPVYDVVRTGANAWNYRLPDGSDNDYRAVRVSNTAWKFKRKSDLTHSDRVLTRDSDNSGAWGYRTVIMLEGFLPIFQWTINQPSAGAFGQNPDFAGGRAFYSGVGLLNPNQNTNNAFYCADAFFTTFPDTPGDSAAAHRVWLKASHTGEFLVEVIGNIPGGSGGNNTAAGFANGLSLISSIGLYHYNGQYVIESSSDPSFANSYLTFEVGALAYSTAFGNAPVMGPNGGMLRLSMRPTYDNVATWLAAPFSSTAGAVFAYSNATEGLHYSCNAQTSGDAPTAQPAAGTYRIRATGGNTTTAQQTGITGAISQFRASHGSPLQCTLRIGTSEEWAAIFPSGVYAGATWHFERQN